MKILLHASVALALVLTLVSGLCAGCAASGAEHKCCRETEQAPSCHQPQPSQQERCDCPDTSRILASAVEAKQAGKQTIQPVAIVAVLDTSGTADPGDSLLTRARTLVLPSHDLLCLHTTILRI
ncbi:MAG: hypothetical protein IH602_23380 [Bryobacteraceae bacterium]|nr:hypothetical protein [Bryobacteraceae bacterium]